jgi:dephospho-CoA kinase
MTIERASPRTPTKRFFIGFAGRIGSGKTSAAEHLRSRLGFQYTRYSRVLSEWMETEKSDRGRLQALGWNVMSGGLQVELNSRLIAALDHSQSAVIDGLRHPTDFDSLASTFGPSFCMIFLEAGQAQRFARLRLRFSSWAAFQDADSQPVEASIDRLKPLAALTISNDGPLEKLYQELDAWSMNLGVGESA